MNGLDRRLNAFRPDLADARLKGQVEAARFVEGRAAVVAAPVADMASAPRPDAGLDTQLLAGERVTVFEEEEGWSWAQAARDGYVGYVRTADLAPPPGPAPTHRVGVPRTFVYPVDDMKAPRVAALPLGAELAVAGASERRGTAYARITGLGFVVAAHLLPLVHTAQDYVSVAEALERTPYLWGGKSAFGIDCSGLVQLAMRMAGTEVLRDTDMQQRSIGTPTDPAAGLRRGDLVFWKGHVAIMLDAGTIIHANGHTMSVAREKLAVAVERIAYLYGAPVAYRRP